MADEDVIENEDQADEQEGGDDPPELSEVEQIAQEMGWSPEDEWRGDPEKWVDAKTFLRTGQTIHKKTLERQDAQIAEMRQVIDGFAGQYQRGQKAAYERAIADLKAQQRAAVAEGDTEAFDRIQPQIDALGEEIAASSKPNGAEKPNPDNDPNFIAFHAQNTWYGEDIEMTAYAEQIAPIVARKTGYGPSFYETIAAETKKKFADRFRNARRERPASVEGAGAGAGNRRSGKKGYQDLPPEAKAACDRYVKQGVLTQEQYVADYEWE